MVLVPPCTHIEIPVQMTAMVIRLIEVEMQERTYNWI